MFNDKQYFEVNREERHFGFLLIASIVYDDNFRKHFFQIINDRIGQKSFLDRDDFDIYGEVAIFRDYWYDLGGYNADVSVKENNAKRRAIIEIFLGYFGIDKTIIDKYSVFWTGEIGKSKLWFPGKWNIEGIKITQKQQNLENKELLRLRWACNAKPDVMIISKKSLLFIELKVESGMGTNSLGYNQEETQNDILKLARLTVPVFAEFDFKRIALTKGEDGLINWDEIKDKFTNELVIKHILHIPE